MYGGRVLSGGITTLLVVLLFFVSCSAKQVQLCHDNPPSCANFLNISHPFGLKGDPRNCGLPFNQLTCENNKTLILELYSIKYYVQAIDSNNSTIRVVDAGVEKNNFSSLPFHSFTSSSLFFYSVGNKKNIVFVTCENPVKNLSFYIDTSPYINGVSLSSMKRYSYVLFGDHILASDLGVSCSIDMIAISSLPMICEGNCSYMDIHKALEYGFELSVYCTFVERFIQLEIVFLSSVTVIFGATLICLLIVIKFLCGMPCVAAFLIYKWRRRHLSMYDMVEDFLQSHNNLMPIKYSFSDIKKMTKGFKEKLGEGGYGFVYKGKLRSGRLVAIKILGNSKSNGQDFINEVATIGRIHHFNVVQLIGFCAERSKRALVYEFMSNGSLEKYIFSREGKPSLSCEKMYGISLGVANGIEYLHRGCEMQILHFDIKPHNILLDENFNPKVSDFGLAKLYPIENSIVSLKVARGTMGYMAPEMFYKNIGGVSYKADIYSFGMLLMEMVGRRKNLNASVEQLSQIYFPSWVYDQFSEGKEIEMGDVTEDERKIAKKMIIVALWCIQMKPSDRPSMNKVIEMLEGEVECLQMPPKPLLSPQEGCQNQHKPNEITNSMK